MLLVLDGAGAQAAYDIALDRGWSRRSRGPWLPAAEVAALGGALLGYLAGMALWLLRA